MRMSFPLSFAFLIALDGPSVAVNCDRGNEVVLEFRRGEHDSGTYKFKFESRASQHNKVANEYTWCIDNLHRYHLTKYMWGTQNDPKLFFSGSVEPGKDTSQKATFSTKIFTGLRQLQFQRPIGQSESIERETIFPESLRRARTADSDRASQGTDADTSVDQEKLVDLEGLTKDSTQLDRFLKENNEKVSLFSSTVATVPARKDVQEMLINEKYETYKPGDFARLQVNIFNTITRSADGPLSTVSLFVWPESNSDNRLMAAAGRDLPALRIELAAVEVGSRATDDFVRWSGSIEAGKLEKQLLSYPAKDLQYADVMVTIGSADSDFKFATVPARILVPGQH